MIYDELMKAVLATDGWLGASSDEYFTAEQHDKANNAWAREIVDAVVLKLKEHLEGQIKGCEDSNGLEHHRQNDWRGCDFCDEREDIIEELSPTQCIGAGDTAGKCSNPIEYEYSWLCKTCEEKGWVHNTVKNETSRP